MGDLSDFVRRLKKERLRVHEQAQRIDAALAALGGLSSKRGRGHGMSAAARRKISLAQKARWAKKSGAQPTKPKRVVSAASRRKMAAAQKARWAKLKRKS